MRSSICVSDIKLSRVDLGEISGEERVSSEERKKRGREGRREEERGKKGNIGSVQIVGLGH